MPDEFDIASRLKFGAAGPGASAVHDLAAGDEAARRLFTVLAPQCTLLEKPAHVINQIDNYIAGLRNRHDALVEALSEIEQFTAGVDADDPLSHVCGVARRALALVRVKDPIDPREPDYSRPGIFAHHNCWKCDSGKRPCLAGNPVNCGYPHARND